MICLGLESTAHTFGIGIVDSKGNILANKITQFTTEEGGIKPRDAADHHVKVARETIENALKEAKLKIKDIDLIAFSRAPGLGPCLRVGSVTARALAIKNNLPLTGVNHCIAHIEIGKLLCECKDPLTVYASGANTQIIGFESGKYRVYGETLDTGIGNLLDSFGRALGMGFPAGPKLDELYFKSNNYIELPYLVKGMDLAFSGLLTSAESKIEGNKKEDLAFSLLHTAFAMLTEVTERALSHTGKKELLLAGGVANSKALQEMLGKMCKERKVKLFIPKDKKVLADNGAMIAWLGLLEYKHGNECRPEKCFIDAKQRTDQVQINWL